MFKTSLSTLCLLMTASVAQAQLTGTIDVDISGLPTGGADPLSDEIVIVDLGTGGRDALVYGVGWDVTIMANQPSWLSHVSFEFADSFGLSQNPAGIPEFGGDDFSGTASYSSGGINDISMIEVPGTTETFDLSFTAPGGILTLVLNEFVDDPSVSPDGFWGTPSTITVEYSYVPEPASISIVCIAGMSFFCLRRRSLPNHNFATR